MVGLSRSSDRVPAANAAKAIRGKKLYEYEDGGTQYATLKVVKNDREVWVMIEAGSNGMYKVNIVEKQLMRQRMLSPTPKVSRG